MNRLLLALKGGLDLGRMSKYFATGIIGFAFSSQISHALLAPLGYIISYGVGYFSTGIAEYYIRLYFVFDKEKSK